MIKVVCGIIFHDDKVFVCRRKEGKLLSGFWEFPGGKMEEGESQQEALIRELKEELEMEVSIDSFLGRAIHDYGSFKIELIGYNCSLINYAGKLSDHDAYKWITPKDLLTIKLAQADIPIAKMITNNFTDGLITIT